MPITRANIAEELEPGLNAIFDKEYGQYADQHSEIFDTYTSERAYEEEVLWTNFGPAQVKPEGTPYTYDTAQEGFVVRYYHEPIGLAFAITKEAVDDNLYAPASARLTRALARSMAHTKQVKAAAVLNNGFNSSFTGGDAKELFATDHPNSDGSTFANEPTTAADLSESSLESMWIQLAGYKDDRGLNIEVHPRKLIVPPALVFVAKRLLESEYRPGTDLNDINASKDMLFPDGWCVNHRLTDTDAWFVKTDVPDGLKYFVRNGMETGVEGDFETDNLRYKAYERYSFSWTNPMGAWGSPGA